MDLSLEVILALFSSRGLSSLFNKVMKRNAHLSDNAERIINLRGNYVSTIDNVILFLQGKNPVLANLICAGNYLPEASRFDETADLEWAFGTAGIYDRARHLATLYLEDLSDLISEAVDPDFGFSRYAERLGRSAASFDEIDGKLNSPDSFIDAIMKVLLKKAVRRFKPSALAISVPFPGNLYSALKCGQWIKNNHSEIKVIMGGGYVNTELRSLKDPRIFNYVDYITLDDGEAPLLNLMEYFEGAREVCDLKRTFVRAGNKIQYFNASQTGDFHQNDLGCPDYSGLCLDKYLSLVETVNPMHRLWSDGRWNKLTLAHGCYWGKCSFCDSSLDYIKRYEPNTPALICDRMEAIIKQTGQNGFHFADEAAPPLLLKELALEIIRRGLTVVWWTNIRFEKSFTGDVCLLLKEAGCIAVAGGLEVASDRLLRLINKGVTVSQAVEVASNFAGAGIMVHTYLMYGFPTQTAQESIDALEIVRQLFMSGIVQSGFWHRFAMTVHSETGRNPEKFHVRKGSPDDNPFANNELLCIDRKGCDHGKFSDGLRKSLYNYMHGIAFDFPLDRWFDFDVPVTRIAPHFVSSILSREDNGLPCGNRSVLWLGNLPMIIRGTGKSVATEILFDNKQNFFSIRVKKDLAFWLCGLLPKLSVSDKRGYSVADIKTDFKNHKLGDFEKFISGRAFKKLRENGLIII